MIAKNRIKAVLAESEKSNLWLADELKVSANTVSSWCQNKKQPSLERLYKIAEVLEVDVCELLVR